MSTIAERIADVQARIAAAAARAGRRPNEITLIAVTKTWPAGVVSEAYRHGLRHFGENRAEELAAKRTELTKQLGPDSGIVWHHIGTVQSRKAATVAQHADMLHAADRMKIITRLADQCDALGRTLPVLLQVNISGEESKAGFPAGSWARNVDQLEGLRRAVRAIADRPVLELRGLMTMAPWQAPAAELHAVFAQTRALRDVLLTEFQDLPLTALSMGMTDDFEIAIAEGATHIRVGRAIFGSRS